MLEEKKGSRKQADLDLRLRRAAAVGSRDEGVAPDRGFSGAHDPSSSSLIVRFDAEEVAVDRDSNVEACVLLISEKKERTPTLESVHLP